MQRPDILQILNLRVVEYVDMCHNVYEIVVLEERSFHYIGVLVSRIVINDLPVFSMHQVGDTVLVSKRVCTEVGILS